mmetsp:Transcript_34406/g.102969  ORF Transcript_34406/g.102969 Transcript_34406/m.102969 type:complete len:96 (-) Transcript_34406:269-556(-)
MDSIAFFAVGTEGGPSPPAPDDLNDLGAAVHPVVVADTVNSSQGPTSLPTSPSDSSVLVDALNPSPPSTISEEGGRVERRLFDPGIESRTRFRPS